VERQALQAVDRAQPVRKPRHELGRRAAELLLDEARGEDHRHEQLLFEPQLVVRESSMVRRANRERTA
jgi:LacI family transcriptional regulator